MNGTLASGQELARAVSASSTNNADLCVCPTFVHIAAVKANLSGVVGLGAQDCSLHENGAFTGDISATMLKDAGCQYVILGHSERRQGHEETSAIVKEKARLAQAAGLSTIICVGETEKEREAGIQDAIVIMQLKESLPDTTSLTNTVIAYEPVWAIGTGKTASNNDIREMHGIIRRYLQEKLDNCGDIRILYGGSVKPENAATILSIDNVDGALVGGASLKAEQFLAIAAAA